MEFTADDNTFNVGMHNGYKILNRIYSWDITHNDIVLMAKKQEGNGELMALLFDKFVHWIFVVKTR